jgi:hypothetical protein
MTTQVERVAACLAAERANLAGSFTVLEPATVRRRLLYGVQMAEIAFVDRSSGRRNTMNARRRPITCGCGV